MNTAIFKGCLNTDVVISGTLPVTDGEISYVKACQGSDSGSPCASSWTVPVKKCGSFNIMYLNSHGMCGRYCLGMFNMYMYLNYSEYVADIV